RRVVKALNKLVKYRLKKRKKKGVSLFAQKQPLTGVVFVRSLFRFFFCCFSASLPFVPHSLIFLAFVSVVYCDS
ncbi:MAG: hypothetical protein FWF05_06195, partial [Oscillospiraceae bacterium]|nr:hypothetical protein [Oscillospiraceae bacterium]